MAHVRVLPLATSLRFPISIVLFLVCRSTAFDRTLPGSCLSLASSAPVGDLPIIRVLFGRLALVTIQLLHPIGCLRLSQLPRLASPPSRQLCDQRFRGPFNPRHDHLDVRPRLTFYYRRMRRDLHYS